MDPATSLWHVSVDDLLLILLDSSQSLFVVCIFHGKLFLFGQVCHPFVSFFYLEAVDPFVLLTILFSLGGTI